MNTKRPLQWIIPLTVFLGSLTPSFVDRWWLSVGRNYRKQANQSCGMAHGYALEFRKLKGRAPSEVEFKAWATSRFSEDVRKMKPDPEQWQVDWADSKRR